MSNNFLPSETLQSVIYPLLTFNQDEINIIFVYKANNSSQWPEAQILKVTLNFHTINCYALLVSRQLDNFFVLHCLNEVIGM